MYLIALKIQDVRTKSVTLKGQNAALEYQYKSEPGAGVGPFCAPIKLGALAHRD